ncbi:MAG: M24 family metallopeptidase, partial [Ruminococcaceae bacterium]|nr:M24 family metallopeptidase [Oscillospiraceae bacterium]
MIQIKNSEQITVMKEAGRITAEALLVASENIREGVSTKYIDTLIREHIEKSGAKPSFLGYGGFPGSACISINDEVIHGIPSAKRIIQDGDIVKVDVGAFYKGFHGDSARTFAVGNADPAAKKLIEVTEQSFWEGIKQFEAG